MQEDIRQGRRTWEDIVPLSARHRSLPTGLLQDWPEATPVTLATLANLMISISDNTASDELIALIGKDRLEKESPRNAPYLTTRAMFALNQAANADLLSAWQQTTDIAARREILADLYGRTWPPVPAMRTHVLLAAEWFYTAAELCSFLEKTASLPALAINKGPAGTAGCWREIFQALSKDQTATAASAK